MSLRFFTKEGGPNRKDGLEDAMDTTTMSESRDTVTTTTCPNHYLIFAFKSLLHATTTSLGSDSSTLLGLINTLLNLLHRKTNLRSNLWLLLDQVEQLLRSINYHLAHTCRNRSTTSDSSHSTTFRIQRVNLISQWCTNKRDLTQDEGGSTLSGGLTNLNDKTLDSVAHYSTLENRKTVRCCVGIAQGLDTTVNLLQSLDTLDGLTSNDLYLWLLLGLGLLL